MAWRLRAGAKFEEGNKGMRNLWAKLYNVDLACLAALSLSIALAVVLSACSAPAGEQPSAQQDNPSTVSQDNPSEAPSQKKPEGLWEKNKDAAMDVVPASQLVDASQLNAMLKDGSVVQVIDIRSAGRFAHGYIDGSRNIPAGRQFELRSDEIEPDGKIVLVSSGEKDVPAAWLTLQDLRFQMDDVYVLSGGIEAWEKAGFPTKQREHMGC